MPRSAIHFVLLLAMLWQALAGVGLAVTALADPSHSALHWQAQSHHHDDSGFLHQDDSAESAQHLLCDHLSVAAVLIAGTAQGLPALTSPAPHGSHQALVPEPTLDGPLRPPRPLA